MISETAAYLLKVLQQPLMFLLQGKLRLIVAYLAYFTHLARLAYRSRGRTEKEADDFFPHNMNSFRCLLFPFKKLCGNNITLYRKHFLTTVLDFAFCI